MQTQSQPLPPGTGVTRRHRAAPCALTGRTWALCLVAALIVGGLGWALAWRPVAAGSSGSTPALAAPPGARLPDAAAEEAARPLDAGVTLTPSVYLPLVQRRWPPVPDAPVLSPISNPGCDGNYSVQWSAAYLADRYELQEDDNSGFTSPLTRYDGPQTSFNIYGQPQDNWFYRVRACNGYGCSLWSGTQSVLVEPMPAAPTLYTIDPPDPAGDYCVEWGASPGADSYVLEEDTYSYFPHPTTRYSGPATYTCFYGKDPGTYYYRVKACNECGCSGWSNVRSVVVPDLTCVYIENLTGGNLCVEVYGSGYGEQCSSSGYWFYGCFNAGTYTYHASAWCGSATWTEYFPAGDVELSFWCGSGQEGLGSLAPARRER